MAGKVNVEDQESCRTSDYDFAITAKNVTVGDQHTTGHGRVVNIAHLRGNVEIAPSAVTADRPWNVPRSVNRFFMGRSEVLNALENTLRIDREDEREAVDRKYILAGLGGTGKSEICIKYAWDHRNEYWAVFWVDYTSADTIEASYASIGDLCGLQRCKIIDVKNFLASSSRRWLLIVDNADDTVKHDYASLCPSTVISRSSIIVTTRDPSLCKIHNPLNFCILDQLELVQARDLLLAVAGTAEDSQASDLKAAVDIVTLLGRHTLAVQLAGSFIREHCGMTEYLEIIRQDSSILLDWVDVRERSDYGSVALTFDISIRRLEELQKDGDVSAADALGLLLDVSYWNCEADLETFALKAHQHAAIERHSADALTVESRDQDLAGNTWYGIEDYISRLPNYYPAEHDVTRKLRWRRAMNRLKSFSLVSFGPDDKIMSMHPLVRMWMRRRVGYASRIRAWFNSAVLLVLSYLSLREHLTCSRSMRAQLRACLDLEVIDCVLSADDLWLALPLMCDLADMECNHCMATAVAGMVDRVLHALRDCDSQRAPIAARIAMFRLRLRRSRVLYASRQAPRSRYELPTIIKGLKECWPVLSRHDRRFIESLPGWLLDHRQIDHDAPVYLLEEYLRIISASRINNVSHNSADTRNLEKETYAFWTLDATQCLAQAYHARLSGSGIQLLGDALRDAKGQMNDERLHVSKWALAEMYSEIGQNTRAIELWESTLSQTGEPTATFALTVNVKLSLAYSMEGNLEKAISLLVKIDEMQRRTMTTDHKGNIYCRMVLAGMYIDMQKLSNASRLLEQVRDSCQNRMLDEHLHPRLNRLLKDSHFHLARTYRAIGDNLSAILVLQPLIVMCEQAQQTDDLRTELFVYRGFLASTHRDCEQEDQVKPLCRTMIAAMEDLGPTIPAPLGSCHADHVYARASGDTQKEAKAFAAFIEGVVSQFSQNSEDFFAQKGRFKQE